MRIIDGVKHIEDGDIITINGKNYYCTQYKICCEGCSFRKHIRCIDWQEKLGIRCDGIIFNTFNKGIKNEKRKIKQSKEKIKESQKLIDKLTNY